jgi:hypothetical protein
LAYISSKVIRIPSANIQFGLSNAINLSDSYGLPDSFRLYGVIVSGSIINGAFQECKIIFYDGENNSKEVISLSVGNSGFGDANGSSCFFVEDNSYIKIKNSLFIYFTTTINSKSGRDMNITVLYQ